MFTAYRKSSQDLLIIAMNSQYDPHYLTVQLKPWQHKNDRMCQAVAGLSLKRASTVLYRTTFPTKKKKKKKIWKNKTKQNKKTTDAGLHERIAINRILLVNLAVFLGQDLKNTQKWMKRPGLATIWTWKWYKNGKNDTKSKKKKKVFLEKHYF